MAVEWIAIWGLTAITAALIAGLVAGVKNRNVSFWMGWSFVAPPMLLALALIPSLKEPRPVQPNYDEDPS